MPYRRPKYRFKKKYSKKSFKNSFWRNRRGRRLDNRAGMFY